MRVWLSLTGAGLVLLIAASVWSILDTRSFCFTVATGETIYLPQIDDALTVSDAAVDFYPDFNQPRSYSAVLRFSDAESTGRILRVNRPVAYRGHRLYLMSLAGNSVGLVLRRNRSWPLLLVALGLLCLGVVGFSVLLALRKAPPPSRCETKLRLLGILPLVIVAVFFVSRTIQAGRLPFANMYEALLFFSFSILLFVVLTRDASLPALLIGVGLAVVLLLLPVQLTAIRPLPPALQSPWFEPHVALAFIAYGGLVAAVASPRRGPALPIAFAAFTLAVAIGAVWAEQAWARFWSWDPKETWALITWLFMAAAVAMRLLGRPRAERAASALALAGVVYNFVIVNIVLRGLHSYR